MEQTLWTVELNLNDDYANDCSYHVDTIESTIRRNIESAKTGRKVENWALIGVAFSLEEALKMSKYVQNKLCKINNRTAYGINELLNEMSEP